MFLLSDYGDAPLPYATTKQENGASHVAGGPIIGISRDIEANGIHSSTSVADDVTGLADEDGILFGMVSAGHIANVSVSVQNAPDGARLDAWIDFDGNGIWESTEQIASSLTVTNGNNSLAFSVPDEARGDRRSLDSELAAAAD